MQNIFKTTLMSTIVHKLEMMSKRHPLVQLLSLLAVVALGMCPMSALVSLGCFYLPWISGVIMPVFVGIFVLFILLGIKLKDKRKIIWENAYKLLIIPGIILLAVFIFGISCAFGTGIMKRVINFPSQRYPLSGLEGIAVDNAKRIYCISNSFSRLQVFDASGEFIRGMFVEVSGGGISLSVDESGYIHVFVERSDVIDYCYDLQSSLVSESTVTGFDSTMFLERDVEANDSEGNVYKIENRLTSPRIVKISPNGNKVTIVKDPFYLWVLGVPIPSSIMGVFLLIVCAISAQFIKRG